MNYLSVNQIVKMHMQLIDKTGGLSGIRDRGILESCVENPRQTFGGEELYPSTIMKISRTAHIIIKNHPFVDGNKRIGMLVMLTLLDINDIYIEFTDDEIIKIGTEIAKGLISYKDLSNIILKKLSA